MSPIMANLYMEAVEWKVLETYKGAPPSYWLRYVDDTHKIKTKELNPFTDNHQFSG